MGKNQRTTFAKLQRERARQAKQAEKRERRRARRAGEEPTEGPVPDVEGPAAEAPSTEGTALGDGEGSAAPEV